MSRERWMALFFALGATCFFIGPFPGLVQLVGAGADADTFFIGSILFTAGGLPDLDCIPRTALGGSGQAAVEGTGLATRCPARRQVKATVV